MVRGGTPLGIGAPSLEASNQSQIDDLVQRNRTLEHTNKKLAEQIALEKAKANEATTELQRQWRLEQNEWRQGCDVLQSCHRVVQLRNVVQLEQERMNVLKEQDVTRKEKLLRLQRDFRITMFQAREAELEDRIRELENEHGAAVAQSQATGRQYDQRIAEYSAQLQAKDVEIAASEQEKEGLQETLAEQRETHARILADGEKLLRELERVTLQRDGAITSRDELKRNNEDLARSKAEMLRQIEKWQSLETKGGAEAEAERKKRVKLDIQVQDLQTQLETVSEEHERALQKEKRRVEKLKKAVDELQAASEKQDEESEATNIQLAKAERKIAKLEAALEVKRARAHSSPLDKSMDSAPRPSPHAEPSTKPKSRVRNKPSSELNTAEAVQEPGPSGSAKDVQKTIKRRKNATENDTEGSIKVKTKTKASVEENTSEVEEVPLKSKGKGKAKATQVLDEEVEIVASDEPPPKPRRKNKRKAPDDGDQDDEVTAVPLEQANGAPPGQPSEDSTIMKTQRKPSSRMRSASAQPSRDEGIQASDTEKEPAKKKRRKINIFPPQSEPFSFEAIAGSNSGLNIPTILSPVKESENVPIRSTSGSMIGTIGSMLKSSFTSRR